jgi:hypothetical protein
MLDGLKQCFWVPGCNGMLEKLGGFGRILGHIG